MKKLILLSALFISTAASAQFSFGYYGLHNMHTGFRQGWGFGMNGLSSPLSCTPVLEKMPVKFQLGLGFAVLGAGQKTFKDVTLTDGATPVDVSFGNLQTTIHGLFRVSVPSPGGKFTPYAEMQPGVRMNSSTVDTYDASTSATTNLYTAASATGFNIGIGGGLMVQLNKTFALDAGVLWDKASNPGNMIVTGSANVNDGIYYSMKRAPSSVLTFRFGVRVNLSKKGCCPVEGCRIPSHHTSCGNTHVQH